MRLGRGRESLRLDRRKMCESAVSWAGGEGALVGPPSPASRALKLGRGELASMAVWRLARAVETGWSLLLAGSSGAMRQGALGAARDQSRFQRPSFRAIYSILYFHCVWAICGSSRRRGARPAEQRLKGQPVNR